MSERTWYTAVGMRDPPGEPNTSSSPPVGSSTMEGVIADNMRLPGAMAFASPCTSPNRFGLVQGEANAITPGKRMLSAMTPSIVLDPTGGLLLVLGSPGGSRIPTDRKS